MAAVSLYELDVVYDRPLTVADWDELTEDDRKIELFRGEIVVSASPKYWIVDPVRKMLIIGKLVNGAYERAFSTNADASCRALDGARIDVSVIYKDEDLQTDD